MSRPVCAFVIAAFLLVWPIFAQERKFAPALEAFADKLVAATPETEQIRLLEATPAIPAADLLELLRLRGNTYYSNRDFTNLLRNDTTRLLVANHFGDKALIVDSADALAIAYNERGEFEAAVIQFDRAIAITQEIGNERATADAFNGKAIAERYLGNFELAASLHEQEAAIYDKLGDRQGVAKALLNLGQVYRAQGNNREAITAFLRCLEISREMKIEPGISFATNNLGSAYYDQGDYELAERYFEESLAIKRKIGTSFDIINSLVNIAGSDLVLERFDDATKVIDEGLSLARPDDPRARAAILNESVRVLTAQHKYAEALLRIDETLKTLETVDDPLLKADTLMRLSNVQTEMKNPAEGLKSANSAVEIAAKLQAPYLLGLATEMRGRAARALGDDDTALKAFQDSLGIYDSFRANVAGGPQQQQEFLDTIGDRTHEIVDILVAQQRYEDAFQMAEREKAQVLLSVLSGDRQPLLQHMTGDERRRESVLQSQISRSSGAAVQKARLDFEEFETSLYASHPELQLHRSQVRPVSATQTANLLPNDKAILMQYVVGASKSFLFTVNRDAAGKAQLRVYTLNVSKADISKRVTAFREKIATRDLDFRSDASALYKLLVAPAAADLAGKQTVVIVPDSSLWQLPFQVLTDNSSRYLIEDYALFFVPSATVLSQNITRPEKPRRDAKLLAIGDDEVGRQLASVYGAARTQVIAGVDPAEITRQSAATDYTVIHFAAHGFYDDRHPLYSYLQTSRAGDTKLDARQMMSLDLKAEVAVLSACETGRGGTTGDGLMGMTWAISVAGVPTTVASQWKVDSASTTDLMVNFHRALIESSSSKAKALQQAALATMRKPEYRHPFYWAGFVMVGAGF